MDANYNGTLWFCQQLICTTQQCWSLCGPVPPKHCRYRPVLFKKLFLSRTHTRIINLGLLMMKLIDWWWSGMNVPKVPCEDQRCGWETGSKGWAPPFPLFSEATGLFYTCTWYFAPAAISKAVAEMQHLNGFRARLRMRMRLRRRESCSRPCGCRWEIISPAFCQIQHVEFCQPCPVQLISPNQEQTQLSSAAVCKWQAGERAGV